MTLRYKVSVVIGSLLAVFGIDQFTKYWALNHLMGQAPTEYLNGLFQFVYAENPGAFLGLGGDWSHQARFLIFALFVFFGLGLMLWYIIKKENLKVNLFAYSFIMAGGCGNLWDRVFHDNGHVIDFMLIDIGGPLRTGVFNVADMFIVAGVILALVGPVILNRSKTSLSKT